MAGLFLTLGGDEPGAVAAGNAPRKVSKPIAVRGSQTDPHAVAPKVRSESLPKPLRQGTEPTQAQLAAAPFVAFSSKAAPRWQGVSLALERLGHDDLADETWSMAGWIRAQRTDQKRDDQAILQAQQDLLERVQALPGLDAKALEQIDNVRATIGGYARAAPN